MNILLWLLILICVAIIAWAFFNWNRPYRFTMFFTISYCGFVLPQLIGLSNEAGVSVAGVLPDGALNMLTFFAITCVIACFVGDFRASTRPSRSPIVGESDYDIDRLTRVAFVLTLASVVIHQIGINLVSQEQLDAMHGQFTGTITIIIFFSLMQRYGFAISVLLFIRYRSPLALVCALFGIFWSTVTFLTAFRRGTAADLLFVIILGLYFGRRIVLPAWVLALILASGAFWSNSIGQLRSSSESMTFFEKLQNADVMGEFNHTLTNGGYELANAAMWIWCADVENEYDLGRVHWNQLVHGYFPGQLFGNDLKQSLKFPMRNLPLEKFNYRGPTGATSTGLADSFCSFWYLGFIKFYIIGYVMGRWWNRANQGDLRSQLAYMALMASALHTISHGTFWLMNNYIHMVIFAYPCLWWARRPVAATMPKMMVPKPRPRPMLNFGG